MQYRLAQSIAFPIACLAKNEREAYQLVEGQTIRASRRYAQTAREYLPASTPIPLRLAGLLAQSTSLIYLFFAIKVMVIC